MNKKVSFKNSRGQRLVGVLHIPHGKGPFPVVILCHGFKGSHESRMIKRMAPELVKEKIAVLRFTFSGHKPSEGGYKEVLVSQFLRDIKKALKILGKFPQIDMKRLGMAGHSMGGFTALILASSLSNKFKSVVSVASLYDGSKVLDSYKKEKRVVEEGEDYWLLSSSSGTKPNFKITKHYFKDRLYLKRKYLISKIESPTLVIHGDNDRRVLVKDAYTIFKLLECKKKQVIIKNADHGFSNPKH
ncbi:alpha/beta fold hydrolase, partial [bacterium]|nr:alpha/beta fold hydrolase [bacterium]